MRKRIGESCTGIIRNSEALVIYFVSVDPLIVGNQIPDIRCETVLEIVFFLLFGCAFGSVMFLSSVVLA